MDTVTGNFLALAFEIERLLRVSLIALMGEDSPPNLSTHKLVKLLHEKGLLTDSGVEQIGSIKWLRNMLVHGRGNEVPEYTLNAGIQIASSLYHELSEWISDPS